MQIKLKYIQNLNNLKEVIDCQNLENILDIKKEICKNTEIDILQLRLIFLGKLLKDNQQIKDCKIENNVTIHVVLNNKNTEIPNTEIPNTRIPNTEIPNIDFQNINNVFNQFQNTIQNEEFQNNVTNTMGQFQQTLQNTITNSRSTPSPHALVLIP